MKKCNIGYLLSHKRDFLVCESCSIINHKSNDRCWNCKMPNSSRSFRDIIEEDITQLRECNKKTSIKC